MTYLTFHLVFTIPPILLMGLTQPQPLAGVGGARSRWAIPVLCLIALTYTTPWDNYLVAREVWWYGPERVLATIGFVPIEEYAFFVLQPILTGLFLYQYLGRCSPPPQWAGPHARATGGGIFIGLTVIGGLFLISGWDHSLYLGLILFWACPILAGMWIYAGRQLWSLRRPILVGVGIPTLYLWVADATAIHLSIWTISDTYSLGVDPLGLPIEEALFFLMTNLLIVKGILLFLFDDHALMPRTKFQQIPTRHP